MVFSSIPFLYYFLPAALILYWIAPKRFKNSALLVSSLFFYAWGAREYIVFMLISVVFGYVFGILVEKTREKKISKLFLAVVIVESVGLLCYCKYANFFIDNFNLLFGASLPLLKIALPIGISFYTFQILSYVVDVYRREVVAQRNIINLATYVTMFPQLIAGPIVRYSDVRAQLENRTHTLEKTSDGIRRFVFGLAKKVLVANTLAEVVSAFKSSDEQTVLFAWLYAVCYMLHVYFDFSGYSDMAIGLGKIFGFELFENFNYPYISKSITDFWRRWHMSLGRWFRDYVYIPLGGNRVGKIRHIFNIFVVWGLTGFWHGADWNFLVWGLYFGVLLVFEKFIFGKLLERLKVVSRVYVLFFVMISFIVFDSNTLSEAYKTVLMLFGVGCDAVFSAESIYYLNSYLVIIPVAVVGATPLAKKAVISLKKRAGTLEKAVELSELVVVLALLFLSTAYLVDGSFNPFLYFRF